MHRTCLVLWLIERQILYLLSFRAGFSVAAVAIDRVLFCFGLWLIELGYLKDSNAAAHSVDTGIS